jgi:hypothetical protein
VDLENHLNRHPKRTTDAIPSEGSRGFTILKCRLSELNAVVNNVKQSVDNTTSRPPTSVGYMTYEVHQKLNWALTFPPPSIS